MPSWIRCLKSITCGAVGVGVGCVLLAGLLLAFSEPASAALELEEVDLTRPRILFFPEGVEAVQERLDREPYRTILRDMERRSRLADGIALDDHRINETRFKARAAKNRAFLYAIDRRIEGDRAKPFATAGERQAEGDRVRDWLLNLHDCSRLAPDCAFGGWDRDISTSEELLQFATAYDTLLGAGYDFEPADEDVIVDKLVNLASQLYENYVFPETALNVASLHQNNHRSKSGAALAVAAIVLAEYTPPAGSDPRGVREPAAWLAYGLDMVDLIQRWVLMTGDGAYAEGPFYQRLTHQNILPFARAWDRLVDGRSVVARGVEIPSLWRHPLFARNQRWLLDMTLTDGSLAATDDGNVSRSHYFGLFDSTSPLANAFALAWAEAPTPFETDGSIDLAADALIYYDDARVRPAHRPGSPTSFWVEGGNAIFRSAWGHDGIVALVLGEPEVASELGRDRNGLGVSPESHEHAEPGSFLLHAYGERLALDPGYFTFSTKAMVDRPEHHNMILVDGKGPGSFFGASLRWPIVGLENRPPADGLATLAANLDGDFLDATRVVTRYGRGWGVVPNQSVPLFERRFLFADDRYLVAIDSVTDPSGADSNWTWLVHGNGGAASGGTFEATATGGRWTIRGARLDAGFSFADQNPSFATSSAVHEGPGKAMLSHTVLETSVVGPAAHSIGFLYPTRSGANPPTLSELALPGVAALTLVDAEEDRRAVAFHRSGARQPWDLPAEASGISEIATDATRGLIDAHLDGAIRLAWVEDATRLAYDGATLFETVTPGNLGLRMQPGTLEAVAENADPWVRLPALPFRPVGVDGACELEYRDDAFWVRLGRERRFRVRATREDTQPAADPGADLRVPVGEWVTLDGTASCSAQGRRLTPSWTLVSAPPGSLWEIERINSWHPQLRADRAGTYRVRLVVTDKRGSASREAEVVVRAGDPCEGGADEDLDGLFDSDDPDCDSPTVHGPPVAQNDHFRIRGRRHYEAPRSVLANDVNPAAGEPLVAVLVHPPRRGQLWLRPDGTFRYRPSWRFRGSDRFTYRARNAAGAESAEVTVTLRRSRRAWWQTSRTPSGFQRHSDDRL
ncbi:MAG: heparinase II/III family protein [Deltaproteobacteria bacterium]|nr:heparinase II/III family protein [Deltaproteobacteria bacterium]